MSMHLFNNQKLQRKTSKNEKENRYFLQPSSIIYAFLFKDHKKNYFVYLKVITIFFFTFFFNKLWGMSIYPQGSCKLTML